MLNLQQGEAESVCLHSISQGLPSHTERAAIFVLTDYRVSHPLGAQDEAAPLECSGSRKVPLLREISVKVCYLLCDLVCNGIDLWTELN